MSNPHRWSTSRLRPPVQFTGRTPSTSTQVAADARPRTNPRFRPSVNQGSHHRRTVRRKLDNLNNQYGFIPRDELDATLTTETIERVIKEMVNENQTKLNLNDIDYTKIHKDYILILAILVQISYEDSFEYFYGHPDRVDTKLP